MMQRVYPVFMQSSVAWVPGGRDMPKRILGVCSLHALFDGRSAGTLVRNEDSAG